MKKILVVGASGYLGSRISYYLAKQGSNVSGLCFSNIPDDNEWTKSIKNIIKGDIRSDTVIDSITSEFYDTVIYLVSLNHYQSEKNPSLVNSINVLPVWNLLNSFHKKKTVKKFIYFSTVQIYGNVVSEIIDEKSKTNPINQYGLTHLMAENIVKYYNQISSIKCINVRLSNSYGSPVLKKIDCWSLVVNNFCRDAYLNKEIVIKSDGKSLKDFIHYIDILNSLEYLMSDNFKASNNNTYNLCSGEVFSIFEVATIIKNEYEKRYSKPLVIKFKNNITTNLNKHKFSNQKIQKLGFKSKVNIHEGINEIFNYFESHNVNN